MNGDCLEMMKEIPDGSVDLILTDPPFGVTGNKWDSAIPFDKMWEQLNRVIKNKCGIILFGTQPFCSSLVASNIKHFKYEWIWQKERGVGFQCAKYRPMQEHEHIMIFSKDGGSINYFPIKKKRDKPIKSHGAASYSGTCPLKTLKKQNYYYDDKFPTSILKFKRDSKGVHPTQKPVALCEYLIKTYTLEGQTILDFTMGSGSTGVAAINTGREFIGIELDENYFKIASERIAKAEKERKEMLFTND